MGEGVKPRLAHQEEMHQLAVVGQQGADLRVPPARVVDVQPESATYGAIPSSAGFLPSASDIRSSSQDRTTLPYRQISVT